MNIIGINAYHPDASVALICGGKLIWAAEEERFSRIKHASGFPTLALNKCLADAHLKPEEIDYVALSKNPHANFLRKIKYTLKNRPSARLVTDRISAMGKATGFEHEYRQTLGLGNGRLATRFVKVEHHQAHVASSFFLSGFEESAFLSIDGLGDFSSCMWGAGEGNSLRIYGRIFFPHSAGFLYTAATQFIGFPHFGDEYKIMGMAAYGRPHFFNDIRRMIRLKNDGGFELDLSFFLHHKGNSRVRWQGGVPEQDILYSPAWEKLFGPPRKPDSEITQREKDIACSVQAVLEEIYFHMLNHLYTQTLNDHLCLAGGVAFNSLANGKITKSTPFKHVYIQPAAGDAGTALGAAAFVQHVLLGKKREFVMNHACFGPEYSDSQIQDAFNRHNLKFEKPDRAELLRKTAAAIADGKVIGWFQGRLEFGPRALGNRSILADPRRKDMKDILNQRIKNRETFRPFAPSVPVERAGDFFEMDCSESPFMLKVFPVRLEKREVIPAVSHVDGTARVQTVSRETNEIYYDLITEFGRQTGVHVLLNTSFNESEPIVCTPEDAIQCFLKTRMDMLVLGGCILERTH